MGAHTSGGSLKSWVLDMGSKHFILQVKLGVGAFLSIIQHCAGHGVYGERVAQLFHSVSMGLFSRLSDV